LFFFPFSIFIYQALACNVLNGIKNYFTSLLSFFSSLLFSLKLSHCSCSLVLNVPQRAIHHFSISIIDCDTPYLLSLNQSVYTQ
jgi:hypothetical protein